VTLIRGIQHRRRMGEEFATDLVLSATSDQAPSGLIVLIAVGLIVIPMAVVTGATGLEIVGPMAIVVIGGTITATMLAFYVMPAAYLRWGAGITIDTDTDDLFSPDLRELQGTGSS